METTGFNEGYKKDALRVASANYTKKPESKSLRVLV